jgi:hypothetical protein
VQGLGQGYARAAVRRQLRDIQRQALLAAQFLWLGYVERPHVGENMETPCAGAASSSSIPSTSARS